MFFQSQKLNLWLAVVASTSILSGCRSRDNARDVRFSQLSRNYVVALQQPAYTVSNANPVAQQFSGPHSVEEYLQLGLTQNPEIEEARLIVESLANRVPQAASLPDPMMGMMAYPSPVQTAAGEQNFALSMNQKVP